MPSPKDHQNRDGEQPYKQQLNLSPNTITSAGLFPCVITEILSSYKKITLSCKVQTFLYPAARSPFQFRNASSFLYGSQSKAGSSRSGGNVLRTRRPLPTAVVSSWIQKLQIQGKYQLRKDWRWRGQGLCPRGSSKCLGELFSLTSEVPGRHSTQICIQLQKKPCRTFS